MQRWLVAVLLLVLGAVPARADNATVSLGSTVLDLPMGQVVPLDVTVTDIEGLYGFELHLAFDPALLEVGDADAGTPGVQLQVGDFIPADFVAQNRADNQSGTADFAVTQLSPREPKSGSGTLVTVLLRGRAAGRNGRVEATRVLLADQDGMVLPVSVLGGDVRVLAAGAQLPTETATTTSSPVNATPTQTVDVPAAATSTATRLPVTSSLTPTVRPGAATQGLSPLTPTLPAATGTPVLTRWWTSRRRSRLAQQALWQSFRCRPRRTAWRRTLRWGLSRDWQRPLLRRRAQLRRRWRHRCQPRLPTAARARRRSTRRGLTRALPLKWWPERQPRAAARASCRAKPVRAGTRGMSAPSRQRPAGKGS